MISVVIPSYNRYELLNRAIDSVLKQTHTDYEIIVVDDCSTDSDYEKLTARTDVSYYRLTERSSIPAMVRNFGIQKAKGEWIAFLDDDDYWMPNKLAKQIQYSKQHDFICSDAYCNGKLWIKGVNLLKWEHLNPNNSNEFDYKLICQNNFIITSSVLIRKSLLLGVGLMTESPLYIGIEDYMTWLEMLKYSNRCFFINEALLEYNNDSKKHY